MLSAYHFAYAVSSGLFGLVSCSIDICVYLRDIWYMSMLLYHKSLIDARGARQAFRVEMWVSYVSFSQCMT